MAVRQRTLSQGTEFKPRFGKIYHNETFARRDVTPCPPVMRLPPGSFGKHGRPNAADAAAGIDPTWYQAGSISPSARRVWKSRTKLASPPAAIAARSPAISSW